ncbi:MAG: hypothetical protein IIX96_02775 [Clostridia bacterium]|nr:hypothetical protein [Clostridia bacterium]
MKRVIGIFAVCLISMLLGISISHVREAGVSLTCAADVHSFTYAEF